MNNIQWTSQIAQYNAYIFLRIELSNFVVQLSDCIGLCTIARQKIKMHTDIQFISEQITFSFQQKLFLSFNMLLLQMEGQSVSRRDNKTFR